MAGVYFADTWYFVALLAPRDPHHAAAHRLQRMLTPAIIVTHDAVLTEMLTYFGERGPYARTLASRLVRHALATMVTVHSDDDLFLRALTRYEQRLDKEYSLVDCMSMVVMEERGITHVLTNDHHFSQAGFTVVNQ
jgi:predicted nucleic acid-binding protein